MRLKNSFTNRYSEAIFLFISTLFIRFPFFFRDYIDRDESTFILMGQSIADGYLPYDHLWDLKPPLLFYLFGLIESIFPHSFVAIRFFGVLIVFTSALFLLKIARKANLNNGFLIAVGYLILSSEFGSLQGVMSEHVAVFFLLPGLYFYLEKRNAAFLFIAGVFFGCALFCKLSYAYGVVGLFIFYFLQTARKETFQRSFFLSLSLAMGIFVPLLGLIIPFIIQNKLELFLNSVFIAPLEYGQGQHSWIEKLKSTWFIIALGIVISIISLKASMEEKKNVTLILILLLLGTIYTFFSSGIVNGHYLVQVYPFILMLLLGITVKKNFSIRISSLAVFVLLISFESISEYYTLIHQYRKKGTFYYRQSFTIVNELRKKGLENKEIFFADYHIGYWMLRQHPLTKSTTHPSNLARPYLFKYFDNHNTSLQELKYLMEVKRPDIIVSKSELLGFFPGFALENIYFKSIIAKEFRVLYKDSSRKIFMWQRL